MRPLSEVIRALRLQGSDQASWVITSTDPGERLAGASAENPTLHPTHDWSLRRPIRR